MAAGVNVDETAVNVAKDVYLHLVSRMWYNFRSTEIPTPPIRSCNFTPSDRIRYYVRNCEMEVL